MKRLGATAIAMVAVATMATSSVAAASVGAKQKKVSVEKYAKTLCSTYNKVLDDAETFGEEVGALEITDNSAFQADVVKRGRTLVDNVKAAEKRLKRVAPDIDDGKTVSKLFATNTVELQDLLTEALDKFEAADANGVAFVADVSVFEVAMQTIAVQLTDVTSDITDQDLIGAIGDEKSCHKIFPVTGG